MIIVIGGGIVGTGIAYFLAKSGLKDILLIEKEKFLGTQVTQFCSGGVRHQFTTEINCKFSIQSMPILNILAHEIDYKKYGYLILDICKGITEPRVKMQNKLGIDTEILSKEEIKKRFPFLNDDGIISGSFFKEDGVADPASLLAYYEKGSKKMGVKYLMDTEVKRVTRDAQRGTGVITNSEEIAADWVIIAAGIGSKDLGKTVGLDIPIVHRRKYILVIESFKYDYPLVMEIPTGWYIKKEGDDALVGMSGKVEDKDFDKQPEAEDGTIEATINRIPELEKSGIKKVLTSLSDETPDKHAIIDIPIPGLIIATGFSGHGFMHSPATGQIVAQIIKGEKTSIDISELKLKRAHIKETIAI
ncbi:FAD-binding oxidoreductase [Candidatus Saganbacteria bacterium]|nr:FAD-binding oxidoreductase [Candidatus Saganbacteria bacterium]